MLHSMSDNRFNEWKKPDIEEGKLTQWNWMVQGKDGLSLGNKTDIGAFTYINAKNGVEIGDNVQIGSHCSIYSKSTIDGKKGPVKIGKNALIGSHSTIMPGVTIGNNAVIGAHSFVNNNVPSNSIVVGVPAKELRKKTAEEKKDASIPLFKVQSDSSDIESIASVIRRKNYWTNGPEVNEFEKMLENFFGAKHVLVFNSGTSALHALFLAHDLKGCEVIVPSFSFISTVNPLLLCDAKPIFAESESDTFGLDIDDVKKKITPETKAVVALHYAGYPSKNIHDLRKLCDEKGILLIEDAAEAMGAKSGENMVGTTGDSAIVSFCQNKIITTGEGGAIITNSKEVYEKAKLIRSHGRLENEKDYFSSIDDNDYLLPGYNYRMPSMNAALGISQLSRIDDIIRQRREKADFYRAELGKISSIKLPQKLDKNFEVYQMFSFMVDDVSSRDALKECLKEKGIMTKVYFEPIHLKTAYKNLGWNDGDLPKTEEISKRIITIPFYPDISEAEMTFIVENIRGFFENE